VTERRSCSSWTASPTTSLRRSPAPPSRCSPPSITSPSACCGLTWISTGQLDAARRILGGTVTELQVAAAQGIPIVGLEPSCTGVLRSDAAELLDNDAARVVAKATVTVAELLARTPGYTPPSLEGTRVVAQPHCHHHAVMGWDADARLLDSAGATVERLGGCCGLAGNFGVERGHYEVSVAVAEQALLPAVRGAGPDTVVLADGFSCRTQLDQLSSRTGLHLAQLLADRLPAREPPGIPQSASPDPARPDPARTLP
jgi:Fe-S oxidoreductase